LTRGTANRIITPCRKPHTGTSWTRMKTNLEIEVKLASDNLDRLRNAGFTLTLTKPRHFEDNWLLDNADQSLFKQGAALRVRKVDGRGSVTYKGVVEEGEKSLLKIREEIESEASDPDRLIDMFERLGFHRAFRYQKYRTSYSLALEGRELEVEFDETPMGNFIEIEGDEPEVLRVLEEAGFSISDIIRESYPELQALRCKARGVPLEDLIFE
jgi:adenylate cyclase, class 2